MVVANQYDGGNVGDSNLTQTTQYGGGGEPNSVTDYLYDWRDRLVTTVEGVGSSSGTHPPLTLDVLDNLGEVTAQYQFDDNGGTITLTDSNHDGVPDSLDHNGDGIPTDPDLNGDGIVDSTSPLRALTTYAYDELGRAYKTTQFSVDPTTGAISTASSSTIVSETWYDLRGNEIASYTTGSPMTKMSYDGADRLTASYTTDGGAVNNTASAGTILSSWANANSVNTDIVLTQTEYQYDADGNVILTTERDRFDTDPSTATGALTNANDTASGLQARVYYTLSYYDAADREIESVNVGTNGAVSNDTASGGVNLNITSGIASRPSTMPNRTVNSDTLITTYTYNAAGEQYKVTDPDGIITETIYDALRQTLFTGRLGRQL